MFPYYFRKLEKITLVNTSEGEDWTPALPSRFCIAKYFLYQFHNGPSTWRNNSFYEYNWLMVH